VPAIKDVMLGISQVRKKLELGPDSLPMMIMIADEMEHMIERFEDHARIARHDAARPRAPRTYLARSPGRRGMAHLYLPRRRARVRVTPAAAHIPVTPVPVATSRCVIAVVDAVLLDRLRVGRAARRAWTTLTAGGRTAATPAA
jgi:hypothetical protein